MKRIFLDDTSTFAGLYPFTRTRHTADIRVGILTIREKWEMLSGMEVVSRRRENVDTGAEEIVVPANIIPSKTLVEELVSKGKMPDILPDDVHVLNHPWQIFVYNDTAIRHDFSLLKKNKISQPLPEAVQVIQAADIFVEAGARLGHCMLNASTGPIYISKDAEIMEGSFIRGPFFLGERSLVKMGARIYGATSVGPHCVVGGELKNSVLFGYSNKAHDGYLGDSVIGEWCNLGAGTSNSNIKNTAGEVKVWDGASGTYKNAGLKCGLIMGDYSRAAINSSFNTGTVVGVCCNVFGSGLTPKHITDFTWGQDTLPKYEFEKAMKDIGNWKKMKNQSLTEHEIQQLKTIFEEL
ncbi:MAG: putative sugar nucleotidyl transferase [Chitinophagaceae bacterium]